MTQRQLRALGPPPPPAEYGAALGERLTSSLVQRVSDVLEQPWRLVRNPHFLMERCPRPNTEDFPLPLQLTLAADFDKLFGGLSLAQQLDHTRTRCCWLSQLLDALCVACAGHT